MKNEKIGPTRTFPKGKLSHDDDGGINVAVFKFNNVVRIEFGSSVKWLGLPKNEALEFAELIKKHAEELKEDS